jgi:hypothetical protein
MILFGAADSGTPASLKIINDSDSHPDFYRHVRMITASRSSLAGKPVPRVAILVKPMRILAGKMTHPSLLDIHVNMS